MNKPIFIMMVGLPASGKSEKAFSLSSEYNATIYSSDRLRQEMFGDEDHQENNDKLFRELHRRIKNDLSTGKSVIYDACNINYKRRKTFLQEIDKFHPEKTCHLVLRSYDDCIKANGERERNVPKHVIKRMLLNFWIPQYYEGWDDIIINFIGNPIDDIPESRYEYYDRFNQENEHHSLTLGEHMKATGRYLIEQCGVSILSDLFIAAQWHDVGKPFTKTFENKRGEIDTNAHYYNHHNVGAYEFLNLVEALGAMNTKSALNVANLIQWHMRPFDIEKNGGKEKFVGLVGQQFYDELMLLHEADKAAH